MQAFKVGDLVLVIGDKIEGTITSISQNGNYSVECDDGFTRHFSNRELCIKHQVKAPHSDEELEQAIQSKSQTANKKKSQVSGKRKSLNVWEIDLHSHELLESTKDMFPGEILNFQLDSFKSILNEARSKGVKYLIVIHGIGKGVLRYEVLQILNGLSYVSYERADPREYGEGATEIRFSN